MLPALVKETSTSRKDELVEECELVNLKGNSWVKMKLFWMFGLGTLFQFLIILFTNSFLQLR